MITVSYTMPGEPSVVAIVPSAWAAIGLLCRVAYDGGKGIALNDGEIIATVAEEVALLEDRSSLLRIANLISEGEPS